MKEGQKLSLRTGPLKFNAIRFNKKPPGVVLTWYADTEVVNVSRIRVVFFTVAWPFLRWETAFTPDPEGGTDR